MTGVVVVCPGIEDRLSTAVAKTSKSDWDMNFTCELDATWGSKATTYLINATETVQAEISSFRVRDARESASTELHESTPVMRHNLKVGTIPEDSEPNATTIVESYRNFAPPSSFRHDVETLLRFVPPKYLVGLKTIVLTNRAGLTANKRKQKVRSRNRTVRLADCLGSYSRAGRNSTATVWYGCMWTTLLRRN